MILLKGTAPACIWALLRGTHTGVVEMTTSRGVYLELAGRRVLLCGTEYGVVPNGASLENFSRLAGVLSPGQPVRTGGGVLQLPTGGFRLELRPAASDTAVILPDRQELEIALDVLLEHQAHSVGLAALACPLFDRQTSAMDDLCHMALPYIQKLLGALRVCDEQEIRQNTKGLLGLGRGLTPSGDDVLSGLMYGLRHSPWRERSASRLLTEAICTAAPERTHPVSADYLKALAVDGPFDAMARAWKAPAEHAVGLLKIGSSSGSEMLLGLLLAGKLLGQLS